MLSDAQYEPFLSYTLDFWSSVNDDKSFLYAPYTTIRYQKSITNAQYKNFFDYLPFLDIFKNFKNWKNQIPYRLE